MAKCNWMVGAARDELFARAGRWSVNGLGAFDGCIIYLRGFRREIFGCSFVVGDSV